MYCLRRGNGMPLAWGHTRLLETDWRLITQESHCFSCGSVKSQSNRIMDFLSWCNTMKDIEMVYNFMTKLYNYWKWLIMRDNCLGWDMSIVEQSSNLVIRRGTAEDLEEMKDFLSECIRVNKYIYGEYDWSEFPLEDATFGTFQEVFGQGNLLLGLEEEELK